MWGWPRAEAGRQSGWGLWLCSSCGSTTTTSWLRGEGRQQRMRPRIRDGDTPVHLNAQRLSQACKGGEKWAEEWRSNKLRRRRFTSVGVKMKVEGRQRWSEDPNSSGAGKSLNLCFYLSENQILTTMKGGGGGGVSGETDQQKKCGLRERERL